MASSGDVARVSLTPSECSSGSDSDFPLAAVPKAPAAPLNSQETKQCSRARCLGRILISDSRKQCQRCRDSGKRWAASAKGKANAKRYHTSEKGKATIKRYRATEKGKVAMKRHPASEKGKARNKRYRVTEKGKANQRRRQAKYNTTEKSKARYKRHRATEKYKATIKRYEASEKRRASRKRSYSTPMARLSTSLRLMVKGTHECPVTFPRLGIFSDNSDAREHFQSTFLPWMNWSNQGQRLQDTLPNTMWQIGHRVPKVWYRHEDIGEIKKCWSRANLFAQCAVENHDAKDRNILSQAQWLALKAIWPKQCVGMTDEEAWAWCRDNVDNATRRAARAAPKTAGPSDEAGPSDLRTVEDEKASSEDEGPVALDAYDSDTLVFASSDDEAD